VVGCGSTPHPTTPDRRKETVVKRVILIAATALAVLVAGGIVGRPQGTPGSPITEQAAPADLLQQRISSTQEHLRRVPGDWSAWAGLGMAYLEQSRVSADPTYYPKAAQAVARSLSIRPTDNTDALVARGAIANARHDFAAARRDAVAVLAVNPYHADAYAVLADAETQLGHPAAATSAVQHLLDLRPGLAAYARASYDLEQRGLVAAATDLMASALAAAVDRHDIAFCRVQLGDLAFASGDLDAAASQYSAGLAADPDSLALQRGQARLDAALGRTDRAIAEYDALTRRAPTPSYLLEYADLLGSAGRTAQARGQVQLASAAHQLFVVNGGVDGITGAQIAEANGRYADAVAAARSEWSRRQHADVADALGWALHLAGRDREALTLAQAAYRTGARSATYAFHLGMIEVSLGDHAAAGEQLTRALAINPYFSTVDAPVARRMLAGLGSR
jgi:tetratricopeptide (TPR) repeat protein